MNTEIPEFDVDLTELLAEMRANVEVKDRKYRLKSYRACFVGAEACEWMVEAGVAADPEQAVLIGNALVDAGAFHHVVRDHRFENDYLFYRFAADEDHGRATAKPDGSNFSWADVLKMGWRSDEAVPAASLLAQIPGYEDELAVARAVAEAGVEPIDEHNVALLDAVHPPAWIDPTPDGTYNMVVIGGGTGGLVTAAAVAGLGGRVALIEANMLGGDCLNVGCVPSKALLRCAKAAAQVRKAAAWGVSVEGVDDLAGAVRVDFGVVMERMRRLRAQIAPHDSAERFSKLGVDVFIGRATFTGPDTVTVNGQTLKFAKATIATGASPSLPPIPGIEGVDVLTNHNLFDLTALPPRLGVLGGGVIGVEMAQAFARFGAQVTLFERSERVLPREEADASGIVADALSRDGVELCFGAEVTALSQRSEGGEGKVVTVTLGDGSAREIDALLVATGRKPNVLGLGLEDAGVDFDPAKGVTVDDRLQTSNSDIYAVGDVATRYQFTHAADFMARTVVRNALFFGRDKFSSLIVPWAVYTDPEVAHVGLYPRDLEARGVAWETYERKFADVDRGIVDGETEGFVRVHVKKGSDEILGATIVGPTAGDLISEITLAMKTGTGLGALASVIHPYPTRAEAIRQVGDAYNRTRLTLTVKKLFRGLLKLKR